MARSESDASSESSLLDPRADEGWEDVEPEEEETLPVVSFFSNETFPDAKSMIEDCKQRYNFDFVGAQKQLDLDFYASIKLVNYIRSEVKNGNLQPDISSKELFEDEKYLQPVVEDDALLFLLDDLPAVTDHAADSTPHNTDDLAKIASLEETLERLRNTQSQYSDFVKRTLEDTWDERAAGSRSFPDAKKSEMTEHEKGDDSYFKSYSFNDIHKTMLKDTVRTDAYRDFIYGNKHLFKNKTVLDVGCGTGILSMFCARAGAAKVIAVDNSDIVAKAREIVYANKLDGIITVVRGKIEEVTLPVQQVDIIVSEWMGYCLLYEAMLDSVLYARDRYLTLGGLMVPSHCTLRLAPLSDSNFVLDKRDTSFWKDVYGFDMSAMMESEEYNDINVGIEWVPHESVPAESAVFVDLPLRTIKPRDLQFIKPFTIELNKDIESLDGWLIWFDTFFLPNADGTLPEGGIKAEDWMKSGREGIAFTTGPGGKDTHWHIGVMLIKEQERLKALSKGQVITGSVEYKKLESSGGRALEVGIKWDAKDTSVQGEQVWACK